MARKVIGLSDQAFISVNAPLLFFDFLASIFYTWCLIFPPCNRQRLKPPLKVLLGLLVWLAIMYCVFLTAVCNINNELHFTLALVVVYVVQNSMTVYVWLNFYYYTQIVPARRALFMWVKRNIKMVIYVILLINVTVILVGNVDNIMMVSLSEAAYSNGTRPGHSVYNVWKISLFINVYFFVCLCVMTVSSFSTARYLHKHIGRMSKSGVASESLHRQIRVTITGIFQGVNCVLFFMFYLFDAFAFMYSEEFYIGLNGQATAATLYISGTVLNLGIGQSIFREKFRDMWKAVKVVCGDGTVRNG